MFFFSSYVVLLLSFTRAVCVVSAVDAAVRLCFFHDGLHQRHSTRQMGSSQKRLMAT